MKVENLLSLRDAQGVEHFVYPYWYRSPVIVERSSQLGLWLLTKGLPSVAPSEIGLLDVIRGSLFSLDTTPLRGDEEKEFIARYAELLKRREELKGD